LGPNRQRSAAGGAGPLDRPVGRPSRRFTKRFLCERLRHEDAAGAQRKAWNGAEDPVAVALVEARRLKVDRIQNCADAAALPSLILREPQEATAESVAPQVSGRKKRSINRRPSEVRPV